MQILQWFLNTAAQEPRRLVSNSTPIPKKQCDHHREEDHKLKRKDDRTRERRHVKRVERSKLNCDDLLLFRFLQRKDVSRPFFYHTLNLRSLGTFQRRRRKTTRRSEETTNAVSPLGGNKVLPIADSDSDCKDETKNKKKGVSRMKKLLKWGASTKVMNSKDGELLKATVDNDSVCDESPKISVRLGMDDYYTAISTISKVYALKDDQILCANTSSSSDGDDLHYGIGCWITTDSEFVVLEL